MSNLYGAGGQPGSAVRGDRVFGADNIKRAIQTAKPDHTDASGSIATQPHEHSRERQRRLRQQAKRKAKP
jgi:hypothetical protein